MRTFTTEIINEIIRKRNYGEKLNRNEQIWHQNIEGVRKRGIVFQYTNEEMIEYGKCANDQIYFIEKYCKIFLPTLGVINNINLYDYQKEMIEFYKNNRFKIFLHSRQSGVSTILLLLFLHYALFNYDKNTLIISLNKYLNAEFIKKIKDVYIRLPFFLKQGVTKWNKYLINFENGCRIETQSKSNLAIGYTVNKLLLHDFSYFSDENIRNIYSSLVPTISSISNSNIIMSGQLNGFNLFYELVRNSELPIEHPYKNEFKTMKIYWWQVPGRDENWKNNEIRLIGDIDAFDEQYNLCFKIKNKYKK